MFHLLIGNQANAALVSSALLGEFNAFALALFDDIALELCERPDQRKHELRCAGDILTTLEVQAFFHEAERNPAMRQFLDQAEKIGEASTDAVETVANNGVAVTDLIEELGQFRSLRVLSGREVNEEPIALVTERFLLSGGVLIVGTHADVAVCMRHGVSPKLFLIH